MDETRLVLAGLWVALMLTYLLGDVLRIFAGDMEPGRMAGRPVSGSMWLIAASVMLIPILMLVLTLTIDHALIRWLNIIASGFLVIFNLVGLPYKGAYDNLLIGVSLVFNGIIIWYAWGWQLYS